ncbi:MAG: hypothetical protein NDI69_17365 [Bacteriovoracaceae bacterium]|nr:hypothetical protein [Bacteriovoracaceae bacterium]
MKNLLLVMVMLSSSMVFANDSESYVMFCGNKAALAKLAAEQGDVVTAEDIREIKESRAPILDILKNGKKSIQRLLEVSEQQDTGVFGVLAACGMINELKEDIKQKGCTDLTTNRVVKDKGGIAACVELMAKLPK